jgi:hypothetical protein
LPQVTALEVRRITLLRLELKRKAQKEIPFGVGGERRQVLEQAAKFRLYLKSGEPALQAEAREWAIANPDALPEALPQSEALEQLEQSAAITPIDEPQCTTTTPVAPSANPQQPALEVPEVPEVPQAAPEVPEVPQAAPEVPEVPEIDYSQHWAEVPNPADFSNPFDDAPEVPEVPEVPESAPKVPEVQFEVRVFDGSSKNSPSLIASEPEPDYSQYLDEPNPADFANPFDEVLEPEVQTAAIAPESAPLVEVPQPTLEVPQLAAGDRVFWDSCPGHCSWMNPWTVRAIIDGQFACLDWYEKPVPLEQLRRYE